MKLVLLFLFFFATVSFLLLCSCCVVDDLPQVDGDEEGLSSDGRPLARYWVPGTREEKREEEKCAREIDGSVWYVCVYVCECACGGGGHSSPHHIAVVF